jgi:hypothetical protein
MTRGIRRAENRCACDRWNGARPLDAKNLVQLPYGFRVTANDCLIASGEILKLRSVHDMKSAGRTITNSFPSGLARTTQ